MGSILKAQCKCGFESVDIFAGGGMFNFDKVCNAPAICLKCNIFLIKNYMKKHWFFHPRCRKCWRKITFYNDPQVQKQVPESYESNFNIFDWYIDDEKGTLRLPYTQYYCPKCNEMTMKFFNVGNWD